MNCSGVRFIISTNEVKPGIKVRYRQHTADKAGIELWLFTAINSQAISDRRNRTRRFVVLIHFLCILESRTQRLPSVFFSLFRSDVGKHLRAWRKHVRDEWWASPREGEGWLIHTIITGSENTSGKRRDVKILNGFSAAVVQKHGTVYRSVGW